MRGGWVKLWREITEHPVFADAELLKLFMWLVLNAAKQPTKVTYALGKGTRIFDLNVGEVLAGRERIADEFNCPSSTIRNRLRRLSEMGCIILSKDSQKPIIRVENYGVYQRRQENEGQPKDSRQDSQSGLPKKLKNGQARNMQCGQPKTERKPLDTPSEFGLGNSTEDSQKACEIDSQKSTNMDSQKLGKKDSSTRRYKKNISLVHTEENEGEGVIHFRMAKDLALPSILDNPKFRSAWSDYLSWFQFRDGRQLDPISGEARLRDLSQRESQESGKAEADLRLTILKADNTRTIYDTRREPSKINKLESTGRRKI